MLLCAGLAVALLSSCRDELTAFPKTYVGVGVELTVEGGTPRVVRVIAGGPASAAGLVEGTEILAVDGDDTEGMTLAQVVDRMRGPPESQVSLKAAKEGQAFTVLITRRKLVQASMDGGRYVSGRH